MHTLLMAHHFLIQAAVSASPAAAPAVPDANAMLGFTGTILAAVIGGAIVWWIEKRKLKEARDEQNTIAAERDRFSEQLKELHAEVKKLSGLPADAPESFHMALAKLRAVVLYRKALVLELAFEPIPGTERLLIHMTASYTLVNYERRRVLYKIRARMVPEGTDAGTRLVRITGGGADIGSQSFDDSYPEQSAAELKVARDVEIPPNSQNPSNRFEVHMRNIAPQNGSDVFYMLDPTVDVEVRVTKRPENLAVDVQFGHSARDEYEALPGVWRLRQAFLPWQSVHVTWSTMVEAHASAVPKSVVSQELLR